MKKKWLVGCLILLCGCSENEKTEEESVRELQKMVMEYEPYRASTYYHPFKIHETQR
jgi:hypothetical protein